MQVLFYILLILLVVFVFTFLVLKVTPSFGRKSKGMRLRRVQNSPNFKDGVFQNLEPTRIQVESLNKGKLIREMFKNGNGRIPEHPVPVRKLQLSEPEASGSDLKVTWMGHSTSIIELDGIVILTDPVFSKRVSPFSFVGTKTFDLTHAYSVDDLPRVDIVIISHDHYDHLDHKTILKLKDRVNHFVMPLGVGAHLERWGVKHEKISELDWWEDVCINGLKFTATPARHFSGRSMNDRFKTLWASFVVESEDKKVFFGGDSGYHSAFKAVGEKFEKFDLCLLECGQYNENWPYIHSSPEQTVQAGIDLNAKVVMPIHWAKVRLSLHPWTEPVERFIKQAEIQNVDYITPQIGETVNLGVNFPRIKWWKEEPDPETIS